jgi:hypothetical protein
MKKPSRIQNKSFMSAADCKFTALEIMFRTPDLSYRLIAQASPNLNTKSCSDAELIC